jgi:hypothetical protein
MCGSVLRGRRVIVALAVMLASLPFLSAAAARDQNVLPGIAVNEEREAYYGDLHLHTSYSLDALYSFAPQVDPDGAYRFARGEPGRYFNEQVARTSPRLDFLAVTDHAEFMGVLNALDDAGSALSRSKLAEGLRNRDPEAFNELGGWPSKAKPLPGVDTQALMRSAWQRTIEAANRHYEPGKFTTFIGYEWTATPGGHHLHRNVIFSGDKAPNPFTSADSIKPEDLWQFLEKIRREGFEALAIPHNPNVSDGQAFDWVDSDGRTIDRLYAGRRAANEPLVEIVQNKGQSEIHPLLAPNDELAGFELLDLANNKIDGGYVRDALGRGLAIAQRNGGVNPFKYGFVGGTDFHNGLSESAESAYAGLQVAIDPAKRIPDVNEWLGFLGVKHPIWLEHLRNNLFKYGSGALTGVWAEQNTRESIHAALRRKETFATSGTRLKFRFFGGWYFDDALFRNARWVDAAYRSGVPMGGDLSPSPTGKAVPQFAIWAVKDPKGANLDRVQVVKVWLQDGKHVEKVHDVALSGARKVDPNTGRAPPIESTVNLEDASYANTIGAAELATIWQDPQFNPRVPALYYLRVIEIPTLRWSTIIAVKRAQPRPPGVPATVQERGWSSPIWYAPPAR